MTSLEKKNKRKGIIGTILFHTLLLILFYFIGLSYQDPPPKEEGININFGISNNGIGKIEPEHTEEVSEIREEKFKEQVQSTEEAITQEEIETPAIPQTKKEKQPKEEIEEIEETEEITPEINTKAIYTGKKKDQKKAEGKDYGIENQGSTEGELDGSQYDYPGNGNNGNAYQLGGRNVIQKPKPKGNQIEGTVVVIITVDRLGNVIYASAGAQGSTTLDKELLKRAKIAALKTKFDTKTDAPKNQNGKIIYDFSLN